MGDHACPDCGGVVHTSIHARPKGRKVRVTECTEASCSYSTTRADVKRAPSVTLRIVPFSAKRGRGISPLSLSQPPPSVAPASPPSKGRAPWASTPYDVLQLTRLYGSNIRSVGGVLVFQDASQRQHCLERWALKGHYGDSDGCLATVPRIGDSDEDRWVIFDHDARYYVVDGQTLREQHQTGLQGDTISVPIEWVTENAVAVWMREAATATTTTAKDEWLTEPPIHSHVFDGLTECQCGLLCDRAICSGKNTPANEGRVYDACPKERDDPEHCGFNGWVETTVTTASTDRPRRPISPPDGFEFELCATVASAHGWTCSTQEGTLTNRAGECRRVHFGRVSIAETYSVHGAEPFTAQEESLMERVMVVLETDQRVYVAEASTVAHLLGGYGRAPSKVCLNELAENAKVRRKYTL